MPTGRPSKYKEEYNEQAYKLCLLGYTDKELADFFNIDERTINNWKETKEGFLQSLKDGKAIADANVSESLYNRAKGYTDPDGKHYPPDPVSCIYWLKNRQRGKWKDKWEDTNDDERPISVNIKIRKDAPEVLNSENDIETSS